jgi:hypothetical protein
MRSRADSQTVRFMKDFLVRYGKKRLSQLATAADQVLSGDHWSLPGGARRIHVGASGGGMLGSNAKRVKPEFSTFYRGAGGPAHAAALAEIGDKSEK